MTLSNTSENTSSLVAGSLVQKALQEDRMGLDLRTMGEGSKEAKIRRIAVQFEEMLISNLLKSAFKDKEPEETEEGEEKGVSFGRINDLRNMFLSQHIADNGGLGYRQVIEEQIRQAYFNNGQAVDGQKGGVTALDASKQAVLRPPDPVLPGVIRTRGTAHVFTPQTEPVAPAVTQPAPTPPPVVSGTVIQPVDSDISSDFGWRQDPIDGETRFHHGVDFKVPAHTPVRSIMAGEVVFSGWESGYGKLVEIKHDNGITTRYGHNSKLTVKVGDRVEAGSLIARSGSTGRSTGPHLHFEIRKDDLALDPMAFFLENNTNVLARNAEIPNVEPDRKM